MKIAVGQLNLKIADFTANVEKILAAAQRAVTLGADLLVTPELSVCGYPPLDLLEYPDFLRRNAAAVEALQARLPPDLPVLVGWVSRSAEGERFNTASIVYRGAEVLRQEKTLLPNYDVFDERRYFSPARTYRTWVHLGRRLGILICEDLWYGSHYGGARYDKDPLAFLARDRTDVILGTSASPYTAGKMELRLRLISEAARRHRVAVVYANLVGGNDALVFDGGSFAVSSNGKLLGSAPRFEEGVFLLDLDSEVSPAPSLSWEEEIFQALVMGTRDYALKCGFAEAVLGLSGGIDSAVVAVIARHALGADKVTAVAMPGPYSSPESLEDAQELARRLGIRLEVIPILTAYEAYRNALRPHLGTALEGLTSENLQARIRGNYLMAWSNATGSLLLTTGNKSELATGYCTLYGDMAGGLAVIGDLFKGEVYRLARWINRTEEVIPQRILEKPPSAELRENQKDTDTLPEYPLLDAVLRQYLLEFKTATEIGAAEPELVRRVLKMLGLSEYKRFQAAPVLKVSEKSFGMGRRFPIARAYPEWAE